MPEFDDDRVREFWEEVSESEGEREAFEQVISELDIIPTSVKTLETTVGGSGVAASRRLRSNQIVSLPPKVQKVVSRGEGDDMQILWHCAETEIKNQPPIPDDFDVPEGVTEEELLVESDKIAFPVLAPDLISQKGINFVTAANVYEEKETGERDIRLSNQLPDEALDLFDVGDEVFFVEVRFPAVSIPNMVWLMQGRHISTMFSLLLFILSLQQSDAEDMNFDEGE